MCISMINVFMGVLLLIIVLVIFGGIVIPLYQVVRKK